MRRGTDCWSLSVKFYLGMWLTYMQAGFNGIPFNQDLVVGERLSSKPGAGQCLTLCPLSFHSAASLSLAFQDRPGWRRRPAGVVPSAAPACRRPDLLRPTPRERETSWKTAREGGRNERANAASSSRWRRLWFTVVHLKAIFFSRWASIFSVDGPSVWGCSSTGEETRGVEQEGERRWEASWDCGVTRSKDSWEAKMKWWTFTLQCSDWTNSTQK